MISPPFIAATDTTCITTHVIQGNTYGYVTVEIIDEMGNTVETSYRNYVDYNEERFFTLEVASSSSEYRVYIKAYDTSLYRSNSMVLQSVDVTEGACTETGKNLYTHCRNTLILVINTINLSCFLSVWLEILYWVSMDSWTRSIMNLRFPRL